MLLTVHCETCKGAEVARTETPYLALGAALLAAVHATTPHSNNHVLVLRVDGRDLPRGPRPLRIACIHEGCGGAVHDCATTPELVPALVIAFHAQHEGHKLRIEFDGAQIHPPI